MWGTIDIKGRAARREFEALVSPWLDALYASAVRLTRNERNAEDLVQDTVMRAWRFFDRFQRGTNFRAWLFKILTNTFINKYRRRVLERSVAQSMERTGETGVMSSGGVRAARDAEETLQFSLMSEAIHKALGDLPEEFRLAVVLCDVEEFSYREIADIMECPVGTVMSRLFRGRKQLQKLLTESPEVRETAPIDLNAWRERKNLA